MVKQFKIKFNDLICPKCGEKIYIHKVWDKLAEQYETTDNPNGYTSIIMTSCKCGKRLKVIFDCHETHGHITTVVNKII